MPPDAPGEYLIARIRGGDVAAVSSPPPGAPPMAMWNTYIWVDDADETAAKRFYSAVFGWDVLSMSGGEFWILPACGDYLEQLTPGIRKMTADMGAAGFEEVVASIQPLAGDAAAAPAHWAVQFSTDDADLTAAKAAELGGEVVAKPADVPWARITVLKDPQGATFIASKYVPENKDLGR